MTIPKALANYANAKPAWSWWKKVLGCCALPFLYVFVGILCVFEKLHHPVTYVVLALGVLVGGVGFVIHYCDDYATCVRHGGRITRECTPDRQFGGMYHKDYDHIVITNKCVSTCTEPMEVAP